MQWNTLVPEFAVTDMAASLRFYTDGLGFRIAYTRDDPPFAYLELPDGEPDDAPPPAQLMLELANTGGWQTGELVYPLGRGINFQIECADATALRNRAVAAGYALFRDLKDTWYGVNEEDAEREVGAREFLIQDPDGYLLRFAQDLGERPRTK